jgi:hypothetical protein
MAGRHGHLRGLATAIHGISGLAEINSPRKFSDEIFSGIDLGKEVFSLDRCRSISLG